MQNDKYLKIAMNEIEQILEKHDLSGTIFLNDDTNVGYKLFWTKKWNGFTLEKGKINLKSNDKDKITNSINFLVALQKFTIMLFEITEYFLETLRNQFKIEVDDIEFTHDAEFDELQKKEIN